ncbi:methyltransferase domain-containing protein [Paraburkholderia sp. BL6665CI2N2]|uniref:class I SAM-dependent methyltransferase n=1 Tax=Paraburkholderia sp. BL6665CI2N2 TaxID=1938806 RepID=UPI001065A5F8|nr:methyltransferase domain-containing protein [Paraburkholderia sp. BL6665CI2N2]
MGFQQSIYRTGTAEIRFGPLTFARLVGIFATDSQLLIGFSHLLALGQKMNIRDKIRSGIDIANVSVMEIGPLYRPFILKSEGNVVYVDHTDTQALRLKYKDDPKFDVADIVEVDAIWGHQSLLECLGGKKVDYVIASHVIEHVPDLITWLGELGSVLREGGEIRLVIPDKRYTFDYTRRVSQLPEIIEAYLRRTRRPLPWNILDHVLNVRQVDTGAAWKGPLTLDMVPLAHPFEMAIAVAKDAIFSENYHDVHCWVFTPQSFAQTMCALAKQGLIDLRCEEFGDTPHNSLEFVVFTRPSLDRAAIIDSWKAMAASVRTKLPGSEEERTEKFKEANQDLLMTVDRLESKLTETENKLTETVGELRNAEERLSHVTRALFDFEVSASKLRTELDEVRASSSWRITAPVRRIVQSFRRGSR